MRLGNVVTGVGVLALALLGGLWLFLQQSPGGAVQEKCVKDQRAVLTVAYIRLPEGVTWEGLEAEMLAFCECVGREAGRQLTQEELIAIVQEQITPAIEPKIAAVYKKCRPESL